jgi:uncharacterized protein (DUF1015 family)
MDLAAVLSPPYDVLSEEEVRALWARDPHNITRVDVPENGDYDHAAELLWQWVEDGVLTSDADDTLSIYRLAFTDATGSPREISGVLGGLAVVDDTAGVTDPGDMDRSDGEAGGEHDARSGVGDAGDLDRGGVSSPARPTTVLPHEHTTPKAKTDRLDLTQATATNLSPVWGLSLAHGLTDELREPGALRGSVTIDGVTHTVEKVADPARIKRIRAIIAADDVLIADGHHRYAISRTYRDEVRSATGRRDTLAEHTLAFINELVEDQLSIEAIHRLCSGISPEALREALTRYFDVEPVERPTAATLGEMVRRGRLVVVWPDGKAEWLIAKPGAFDQVRALDGAWLEAALAGVDAEVTYQHGLDEVMSRLASGGFTAAILIRPTSIEEIERTAREGLLMPPKSTFFTPKLLTGWVLRPTEPLPGQ